MSISFERTNWVNNSAPAITAAQLNRMEKGISDCVEAYNTIPTVYKFKGTLEYFSDLPTENNEIGDVYNIFDDGYNYAWNGSTWQVLNISIDLTPISQDYIVEQGTKEVDGVTWTYEKWNSGKARCYGVSEQSIKLNQTWGNGMYYGDGQAISYPFEFVETPICHMQKHTYTAMTILDTATDGSSSQTKKPRLICVNQLSAANYKISFDVTGKWK